MLQLLLWSVMSGLADALRTSASSSDSVPIVFSSVADLPDRTLDALSGVEASLPFHHMDLAMTTAGPGLWLSSEAEIAAAVADKFRRSWDFPFSLLALTSAPGSASSPDQSPPLAARVSEVTAILATPTLLQRVRILLTLRQFSLPTSALSSALDTLQHSPWFAAVYRLWTESESHSRPRGCQSDPGLEKTVVDIVTDVARIRQVRMLKSVQWATLTTAPPRSTAEAVKAVLSELERTVRLVELQPRKETAVQALMGASASVMLEKGNLFEKLPTDIVRSSILRFAGPYLGNVAAVSKTWRSMAPSRTLSFEGSSKFLEDEAFRQNSLWADRPPHLQLDNKLSREYLDRCLPERLQLDERQGSSNQSSQLCLILGETRAIVDKLQFEWLNKKFPTDLVGKLQSAIDRNSVVPEQIRFVLVAPTMEKKDVESLLAVAGEVMVVWGRPAFDKSMHSTVYAEFPMVRIEVIVVQPGHLDNPVIAQVAKQIRRLQVWQAASLDFIHRLDMENLSQLEVSGTFQSLQPLTGLRNNLRELSIEPKYVHDLTPLAALVNLQRVTVTPKSSTGTGKRPPIQSLEPLSDLKLLNYLNVSGVFHSLQPLEKLANLQELHLSSNHILDINPLGNLRQLKRLRIDAPSLYDFLALANLENLEYLDVANTQFANMMLLLPASKSLVDFKASQTTIWSDAMKAQFPNLKTIPKVTKPLEPQPPLLSRAPKKEDTPTTSFEELRKLGGLAFEAAAKAARPAIAWVKDSVRSLSERFHQWRSNFKFPFAG